MLHLSWDSIAPALSQFAFQHKTSLCMYLFIYFPIRILQWYHNIHGYVFISTTQIRGNTCNNYKYYSLSQVKRFAPKLWTCMYMYLCTRPNHIGSIQHHCSYKVKDIGTHLQLWMATVQCSAAYRNLVLSLMSLQTMIRYSDSGHYMSTWPVQSLLYLTF